MDVQGVPFIFPAVFLTWVNYNNNVGKKKTVENCKQREKLSTRFMNQEFKIRVEGENYWAYMNKKKYEGIYFLS